MQVMYGWYEMWVILVIDVFVFYLLDWYVVFLKCFVKIGIFVVIVVIVCVEMWVVLLVLLVYGKVQGLEVVIIGVGGKVGFGWCGVVGMVYCKIGEMVEI